MARQREKGNRDQPKNTKGHGQPAEAERRAWKILPSDPPGRASCLRNLNSGLVVSRTVRQYISFGKKKRVLGGICLNFALTFGYLEAEFSFHETNHIWNTFPEDRRHLADFQEGGLF